MKILGLLIPHWKRILAGFFILLVVDLGQLIIPIFIKNAVDRLYLGKFSEVPIWALYIFLVAMAFSILRFFWRIFFIGTSRLIERDMRDVLYQHLLKLHPHYFNSLQTGDVIALFTNDLQAINMALGMGLVAISDFLIYTSFSIIAMLIISPLLTAMVIIPLPFLGIVMFFLGRKIHRQFLEIQDYFGYITEWIRDIISGIRVVKAYDTEGRLVKRYEEISKEFLNLNVFMGALDGIFNSAIFLLAYLSTAILLLVGGSMTTTGKITLGDYVAFGSYIGMMIWPMMALGWFANLIQRGNASYDRILNFLKVKPEIDEGGKINIDGFERLETRSLTFSIGDKQIIKGINFEVRRGEIVGITGPTGSGKSVFLHLLARFYNPIGGEILINGFPWEEVSTKSIRKHILLLPQEPFIFSLSIRENLLLANPSADEDKMWWALEMANLKEDVKSFPKGLDTLIGERGYSLSGGQRQRLMLAMAFLSDAELVLLDESLSALDSHTEKGVVNNLKNLGKTIVLVSHRISSLMDCDRIYMFHEGRVVEVGNFEELISLNGLFSLLYNAQKEGISV
ncbi:MAG: ABC transporter ATP-binding protein [candidate division WOR-3 bacterium]